MLDCLLMRLLRLDMLHYRSFFASQSWDYPGFCCVLITLAEVSVHPIKFILLYRFSISSKSTCRSFRSHCKEERFSILFCIPWDTAKIHFGIQFLLLCWLVEGKGWENHLAARLWNLDPLSIEWHWEKTGDSSDPTWWYSLWRRDSTLVSSRWSALAL